ncbi:MAG: ferritin family protein [Planctomycetota bacterium]|jgi:rubrerythrin
MAEPVCIDDILEFAVAREAEACDFYKTLAGRAENPAMRELILEFAREEAEHKAKLELELMKRGRVVRESERAEEAKDLGDFDIGRYIVDAGLPVEMDYQDLLLLGMKKEKAAFRLYVDLAAVVRDQEGQEILLALAEEEARHKVQLEIDYDNLVTKGE